MNQLSHFSNPAFGSVRVVTQDGEPWFVAADIASALEYRDAFNMARVLDDDEKGAQIVSTPGGDQEVTVINESGFYSAILRSRKPEAKQFRKWVTSEVLPSIRQHGGYLAGQEQDDPELIMAKALHVAQSVIDRKTRELKAANQEVDRLQDVCHTISRQFTEGQTPPDFCKQLNGVNTMKVNDYLVGKGLLRRDKGGLSVNCAYRDKYFKQDRPYKDKSGTLRPKVALTVDGARWLYKRYLKMELPMKADWNGQLAHDLAREGAA